MGEPAEWHEWIAPEDARVLAYRARDKQRASRAQVDAALKKLETSWRMGEGDPHDAGALIRLAVARGRLAERYLTLADAEHIDGRYRLGELSRSAMASVFACMEARDAWRAATAPTQ